MIYHALGREPDSNAALAGLIAKYKTDSAYQIAQAHAFRGESDKAFEWLERSYKQRDPGLTQIQNNPILKILRHDQRFTELLKKPADIELSVVGQVQHTDGINDIDCARQLFLMDGRSMHFSPFFSSSFRLIP